MAHWKRAVLLGLLSRIIPFAISFAAFPVKKSNAPLFATLMFLVVLATAGVLLLAYFNKRPTSVNEALLVGSALVCHEPGIRLSEFCLRPHEDDPARLLL